MAFVFNPPDGYRNVTDFPTKPANEAAFRDQMMSLLEQIQTYMNGPDLNFTGDKTFFMKSPNGTLLQWGSATLSSGATVTLGMVFPNSPISILVSLESASGFASFGNQTNANFKIFHNGTGATPFSYLAIGF